MYSRDLYVLLWSRSQNSFHVESLADCARLGLEKFNANRRNDYILIDFGSFESMGRRADALRDVLIERDVVRRLYQGDDFV